MSQSSLIAITVYDKLVSPKGTQEGNNTFHLHLVKAMVFPVVMYGCESWTINKVECQRTDAFELWCWRRLLRVPWTARRSNQSILKEISPEYSLEGLMLKLKLKLQYFGHLIWRTDSLEKKKKPWCWERLKAGREGDDRGRDGWMASLTRWTWVGANSGRWWRTGKPGMLQSMGSQIVGQDWATEMNWMDLVAFRQQPLPRMSSEENQDVKTQDNGPR